MGRDLNVEVGPRVEPKTPLSPFLFRCLFWTTAILAVWIAVVFIFEGAKEDTNRIVGAIAAGTAFIIFMLSMVGLAVVHKKS